MAGPDSGCISAQIDLFRSRERPFDIGEAPSRPLLRIERLEPVAHEAGVADPRIAAAAASAKTPRLAAQTPEADPVSAEAQSPFPAGLSDWRGETLARVRALIKQADPEVVEEWKWVKPTNPGTPVWSHNGGICTGEAYKNVVKLTFFKGAALNDPSGLFNSSLDGNVRRAIDIKEDDTIDEAAVKDLIREAVALNLESKKPSA